MSGTAIRVLAVLELLQARDKITGSEIAEQLNVDTRSVRRYIKQLQQMGIPVTAERGRYGAYQIETGYQLPPLMFREGEIIALILGLMVVRASQFPVDSADIAGAIAKIQRTVPQEYFNQVQAIQDIIQLHIPSPNTTVQNAIIDTIAKAIWKNKSIEITYESRSQTQTIRQIDAFGIVYYQNDWYTVGYCHLRSDLRIFRVDRIQEVPTTRGVSTPHVQISIHLNT